jgi:hypothetical protein
MDFSALPRWFLMAKATSMELLSMVVEAEQGAVPMAAGQFSS